MSASKFYLKTSQNSEFYLGARTWILISAIQEGLHSKALETNCRLSLQNSSNKVRESDVVRGRNLTTSAFIDRNCVDISVTR